MEKIVKNEEEEVFIQKEEEEELHNDGMIMIDQRELLEVVSATTNKLSGHDSLKEEEVHEKLRLEDRDKAKKTRTEITDDKSNEDYY